MLKYNNFLNEKLEQELISDIDKIIEDSPFENKSKEQIALDLAKLFLNEFSSQEEVLKTLKLAPGPLQNMWKTMDIEPLGVDRMVVEGMHRSHMGVDHDYKNILNSAFKISLADGWGGSRMAMIVSDILFGTPSPIKSAANLGVLSDNKPNIVVIIKSIILLSY